MTRVHEEFLLFRAQGGSLPLATPSPCLSSLRFSAWRPTLRHPRPPEHPARFGVWWALHEARVFRSRQYSVVLVRDGDRIVHRSCVMPAWFRWPFMASTDLQISDTWTDPEYRGRGIASFAARLVVARADPSQTIWYATSASNVSSLAVCRSLGMESAGRAIRAKRLGLRVLGSLEAEDLPSTGALSSRVPG